MATKDAAFISISAMRNLLTFYSIFCLHCKLTCAQDIIRIKKDLDDVSRPEIPELDY